MKHFESKTDWKPIGTIGKPHGLKGAFYIRLLRPIDQLSTAIRLGDSPLKSYTETELSEHKTHRDRTILRLAHFIDRTSLEPFIGAKLWANFSNSDQVDYESLIGYRVLDTSHHTLGQVHQFYNHGATDTMELFSENGEGLELPYHDEYIKKVSHNEKSIYLNYSKDFFEGLWF